MKNIAIQAEEEVLIDFDDMIAYIMTNKRFQAIRCRKLNISLVFIT